MVEHMRDQMIEMVKREAEKNLADKNERLNKQYKNIKNEIKTSYENVVKEFRSKIL